MRGTDTNRSVRQKHGHYHRSLQTSGEAWSLRRIARGRSRSGRPASERRARLFWRFASSNERAVRWARTELLLYSAVMDCTLLSAASLLICRPMIAFSWIFRSRTVRLRYLRLMLIATVNIVTMFPTSIFVSLKSSLYSYEIHWERTARKGPVVTKVGQSHELSYHQPISSIDWLCKNVDVQLLLWQALQESGGPISLFSQADPKCTS